MQLSTGNKHNDAGSSFTSAFADGDVFGIALDLDNGKVWFSKNGTYPNSGDPAAGLNAAFTGLSSSDGFLMGSTVYSGGVSSFDWNFGQRAFAYTPPAGFQALNTKNLPTPTVLDGTKYFNTVLYTGTGSSNAITGVGFQPSFTWIKKRSGSDSHELQDVVRGATKRISSDSGAAEQTIAGSISSFDSDGFTVVDAGMTNESGHTYAAWNWKAGGAASDNQDGSIISDVSVLPEAGFSIAAYTGTGSETTVGHGLGVTPGMIWVKNRDATEGWIIDSRLVTGNANGTLHFNTDAEYTGGTNQFGTHSSSIFTVKTSGNINTSGQRYVAYVFSEVEGYSKFGKFTGNGSSSDGPYAYCGFKPAWILLKNISNGGESFRIYDVKRDTFNFCDAVLNPNNGDAESTPGSTNVIDILSNGFKVRSSSGEINNSGSTILYMAFAEMPFKYANAR